MPTPFNLNNYTFVEQDSGELKITHDSDGDIATYDPGAGTFTADKPFVANDLDIGTADLVESGDVLVLRGYTGPRGSNDVTSTSYTDIGPDQENQHAIDLDGMFPSGAVPVARVHSQLTNDTAGETTFIRGQVGSLPFGEVSSTGTSAERVTSDWIDISSVSGTRSLSAEGRVSGGTGSYFRNCWQIDLGIQV